MSFFSANNISAGYAGKHMVRIVTFSVENGHLTGILGANGIVGGEIPIATGAAYSAKLRGTDQVTLAFFGEEHRKALALCGSKSGREVDKVAECGFTVAAGEGNAPYFEQAELVLVCRKLFRQAMDESCFLDKSLIEKNYPGGDFHVTYVGEIVESLVRE